MTDKKYEELLECAEEAVRCWYDDDVQGDLMDVSMDSLKACLPPPPPSREEIADGLEEFMEVENISDPHIKAAIEELRKEQ